ncbi:hypothetical protein chiPu_0009758 [Chiloscyllium punctatum]|uniref:Uncharacterized protein n=1 Tax=Chiloscyllium punctatum TaxID=137246 RepID=A0A401SLP9_CHIPU|nr:hypothetical protein [Chiloscyllium punctatum]
MAVFPECMAIVFLRQRRMMGATPTFFPKWTWQLLSALIFESITLFHSVMSPIFIFSKNKAIRRCLCCILFCSMRMFEQF